jgi:hypothetical protein
VIGHAVRPEGHGGHGRWAGGLAAAGLGVGVGVGVIGGGWYGGRAPPHVLGDLARGEVLGGYGRGYEALAAHGGEAGLEVALRALSRAVAKMRAVYERRLALGGMHDGRARVVWGGCGCDSRGRLGRRRLDRGCRWVLVVHGRACRLGVCGTGGGGEVGGGSMACCTAAAAAAGGNGRKVASRGLRAVTSSRLLWSWPACQVYHIISCGCALVLGQVITSLRKNVVACCRREALRDAPAIHA